MKSTPQRITTRFVTRLGLHHFAHLRALAEGIETGKSACLYLGVEHGNEALTASRQTIDAVRAVARRCGERSAWRLIGLTIRPKSNGLSNGAQSGANNKSNAAVPSLEEFITARDLDGWGQHEVLEMYADAYPENGQAVSVVDRRDKLRTRQLALLSRLEQLAVEIPAQSHAVSGWFDDLTSTKLVTAGLINLGLLKTAIETAGRWYRAIPGVGKHKAERIASFLQAIMPSPKVSLKPVFALALAPSIDTPFKELVLVEGEPSLASPARPDSILRASNDMEAVSAWIAARAGAAQTAVVYQREAVRLLLWLQHERPSITLAHVVLEDCLDYMAFLQNIPAKWMSRRRAEPFSVGWAPFRGQLSHDSQHQSVVIVASLFQWLHAAGYLKANPWVLVNKRTGDDKSQMVKTSKSISEFGFSEILKYIDEQIPTLASERMRFVFTFLEAVGLRSNEFLNARLGHFDKQEEGWVLYVSGKGSKNRFVFIAHQAFVAMQRYLAFRGLQGMEHAPPETPLVASTTDPTMKVGYQAFYESVKSWTQRAIRASSLPAKERLLLEQASPHWLRHTFGARSVARDVAMDAIQAQMGHASIQTTMSIYGRAPMRRRAEELTKAFG